MSEAAERGTGSFKLGVVSGSGLPTVTLTHGIALTNPVANVLRTGLNWTLAAGDYWLVATGDPDATEIPYGQWQGNNLTSIRPWAFTNPFWDATWSARRRGRPTRRQAV